MAACRDVAPEPKSPTGKPATFQYPHAIEHGGHLLIAYSRNKRAIEVLKIPVGELK